MDFFFRGSYDLATNALRAALLKRGEGHYGLATVRLLLPLPQALRPSHSTTASTTAAGTTA